MRGEFGDRSPRTDVALRSVGALPYETEKKDGLSSTTRGHDTEWGRGWTHKPDFVNITTKSLN